MHQERPGAGKFLTGRASTRFLTVTMVQGESFVSFALKPGCQARAISICFPLQQPLMEVFIPPQVGLNLQNFRPVP